MRKLLTLLTALFITLQAISSHFAGGDITYKCMGGNDYQITLSFYRDCSGMDMTNVTTAQIFFKCSSNSAFNFNTILPRISGPIEVTQPCPGEPTRCSNGLNYGIQEFIFQSTVTLAPCNSWYMYYTSGARNPVTTVYNNGSNNWYVTAMLNNLQAPCNSSPKFSNRPVGVFCNGQSSCFNHGALDINGDSLVYSFFSPYTNDTNSTVTYILPYSYINFLQSNPPISLNTVTGDICFTPTANLTTITGVRVKEYRKINGVYVHIGTVYRDLQIKIDYCINNLPILSGMDTLNSHTYKSTDTTYFLETCYIKNKIISFDINGFDPDTVSPAYPTNNIFSITWNNGIPQGTFQPNYNNTDSAYAHFNWMLQSSDISNIPKCFTATIKDQACPYNGAQTFSYCFIIRGMKVALGTDTLLCKGEIYKAIALGDTTTANYNWYLDGVKTTTPLYDSTFTLNTNSVSVGQHYILVKTDDGNVTTKCPGIDTVNVNVVYQPDINGLLKDMTMCKPDVLTYDAGQGNTYIWTKNTFPYSTSKAVSISESGNYIVFVDGGNNTRCIDLDTFDIYAIDKPNLGTDTCGWLPSTFNLDAGLQTGLSYLWNDGSTIQNLLVTTSGTYKVSLYHPTINSSLKCSDEVIINILDKDKFILSAKIQVGDNSPIEDLITGDRTICTHQKLKIVGPDAPTNHSYDYKWILSGVDVSATPYYIYQKKVVSDDVLKLYVYKGCSDSIKIKAEYCAVNPPNVITPNGDLLNDNFVIKGLENFPNSTILIYNRWGTKVFESKNYRNDWDGRNYPDGVYFWVLKVEDGQNTEYQGTLTIIRK